MNLIFEPLAHTYRRPDTGAVVVNVTRALGLLTDLSKVDPVVLEAARLEGVDMHSMTELYFKRDLDEATLPEWLVPRLAALKRFEAETQFECLATERKLYHRRYDYAGTTDLIGRMSLKVRRTQMRVVACVDLKRSFFGGRTIGFQTAAYAQAWNDSLPPAEHADKRATHRYALKLHANGEYRLEPFADPFDLTNFLTCLNFYRLKESLQ